MEQKKIYVVGVLMNPDMDDEAELHDEEFENHAYRDYETAKEAFAIATKSMTGYTIPLDEVLKNLSPLTKDRNEVGIQDGYKAVRFQKFDHMPDMDIVDSPLDPNYFLEEETIKNGDGEESE